jgi:hypothetical protein
MAVCGAGAKLVRPILASCLRRRHFSCFPRVLASSIAPAFNRPCRRGYWHEGLPAPELPAAVGGAPRPSWLVGPWRRRARRPFPLPFALPIARWHCSNKLIFYLASIRNVCATTPPQPQPQTAFLTYPTFQQTDRPSLRIELRGTSHHVTLDGKKAQNSWARAHRQKCSSDPTIIIKK